MLPLYLHMATCMFSAHQLQVPVWFWVLLAEPMCLIVKANTIVLTTDAAALLLYHSDARQWVLPYLVIQAHRHVLVSVVCGNLYALLCYLIMRPDA